MSYKRNTDTAIGYVNRHVPVLKKDEWDGLDEGMAEIVLSSIRQHFKDFYQKPKKTQTRLREGLDSWDMTPSMRDYLLRDMMYTRRGTLGSMIPPIRGDAARKDWEKLELPTGKTLRELMSDDSIQIKPRYERPREVTVVVDQVVGIDYSGIEKHILQTIDSKALMQIAQAFGASAEKIGEMFKKVITYDESHHIKPEDLYGVLERTKVAEARPLVGAGKNPFAEHTIRNMKGRRK